MNLYSPIILNACALGASHWPRKGLDGVTIGAWRLAHS